jgi:Protein of unknown function (DUF3309)
MDGDTRLGGSLNYNEARSCIAARIPESLGAMFGKLVLLPLLILLIAVLPFWRHSARWGYIPAGFVAIALLVVYIFARLGRL